MPQEPQGDGQIAALTFVTAFEPFGGASVNGSQEALRHWAASDPHICGVTLPVVREEAPLRALETLAGLPRAAALYLALGEAGREPVVRLELVAINRDDFRLADNAGNAPRDAPIRAGGPAAHFATVPAGRIAGALAGQTALPVQVSLSAGAFLCNHLAYQMLDRPLSLPFLFIHVPAWRPADGEAALQVLVRTLQAVRDAALRP